MPAEAITSTLTVLSGHQVKFYMIGNVSAVPKHKIYYLSRKASDFTIILCHKTLVAFQGQS